MAEKLFPERQRCKACSKGLGAKHSDPVLKGLYCSHRCAKMPNPPTRPQDAPRECVTTRDGQLVWKRRYRSDGEVPDKIMEDPSTNLYWCGSCGHRHVGHSRLSGAEQFRMLSSPKDLGDMLVKLRGGATHAQVGKIAGVRPIRVKELEEGIGHAESVVTLFKVLAVLRARPGIAVSGEDPRAAARRREAQRSRR